MFDILFLNVQLSNKMIKMNLGQNKTSHKIFEKRENSYQSKYNEFHSTTMLNDVYEGM